MAGAAAGWAAFNHSDSRTTLTVECGTGSYIPSDSGDPIFDCRQALALQSKNVPPLVGWITPTGIVAVFPEGQSPPAGSTPMPVGFQQDRSVLFVNEVLNDVVNPLATRCSSTREAIAYVRQQLGIAGLLAWTVKVSPPMDGAKSAGCLEYFASTDATTHTLILRPQGAYNVSGTNKDIYEANLPVKLDRMLHAQLGSTTGPSCLNLADAAALAERDTHQLGIPDSAVIVTQAGSIGASGPTCATPAVDPAGLVQVALWAVAPSTPPGP